MVPLSVLVAKLATDDKYKREDHREAMVDKYQGKQTALQWYFYVYTRLFTGSWVPSGYLSVVPNICSGGPLLPAAARSSKQLCMQNVRPDWHPFPCISTIRSARRLHQID